MNRFENICLALLCAVILFYPCTQGVAGERLPIVVAATPEGIAAYETFREESNLPADQITCITCRTPSRPLASLIIIQQALAAGGLPVQVEFMEVPNTARMRMAVSLGEAVIACQDLFSAAFEDSVYMSSAVIPRGAFIKGIYTTEKNGIVLNARSLNHLRLLRAVSSTAWKVDWATLQKLGFINVRNVHRESLMFRLVNEGEADFALLEFPHGEDLGLELDGIRLVPVPGVKLGLDDSRHFMVSRKHPDGAAVFRALEQGLTVLRKQGRIKAFYTDAGFYNPVVADWRLLNPPH